MKKEWKKFLTGLLILTMALSVMACGNSTNSNTTSSEGTSGSTNQATPSDDKSQADAGNAVTGQKIKVFLSEEPGDDDIVVKMMDLWAEETGNSYETMIISHADQATKFPSMAKNNDLPDLIWTTGLHQKYPEEFVDMSTVMDMSMFTETVLTLLGKAYSSDKIVGLPVELSVTNMYYNRQAFDAAGLTAPTPEKVWTWDELYKNAAKLQETGLVKYGFAADVSRARYDILMYANGGSLVEADGDTFKVAVNSAANIKTLEKFVEANNEVMPKAIWAGGTTDNPVDYFKNGDVGILLSGSWNYSSISMEVTEFDFGVMTTPTGEVSQSSIIGGSAVAIPENAKNKEAALDFCKWLFKEENFQIWLDSGKGLSVLEGSSWAPADEKAAEDFKLIQNEVSYVPTAFLVDESSGWRVYKNDEYRDAIKRAVSGELSSKDALQNFAAEFSESSGWAEAIYD